jgi:hypothetical protein
MVTKANNMLGPYPLTDTECGITLTKQATRSTKFEF